MHNCVDVLRKDRSTAEVWLLRLDCLNLYSKILGLHHESSLVAIRSTSRFYEELNRSHLDQHLANRALTFDKSTYPKVYKSTIRSGNIQAAALRNLDNYDATRATLSRVIRVA